MTAYMNIVDSETINNMTKIPISSLQHPDSKWRKAYLGLGCFDIQKVLEMQYEQSKEDWFKKEMGLFVEYLNKIKFISYSDIAKKNDIPISTVSNLKFTRKQAARILVKYRNFVKDFYNYYESG